MSADPRGTPALRYWATAGVCGQSATEYLPLDTQSICWPWSLIIYRVLLGQKRIQILLGPVQTPLNVQSSDAEPVNSAALPTTTFILIPNFLVNAAGIASMAAEGALK